ncbi:indole-3-glycerol phosphate synthase TrpC [Ureibacillus sp. FSL K6-8385]|uniref:Indole-3-glycerol phosphate synthase n=1 Tax=Ureibacillus terrenus TaxID=118246 RepID=A0A540V273_9BACL|nr:indole-3-glycerol phosphate synthase TrpC [Ureibacillus terrenus]MED3661305.1 indole-3-glycerol phosphate synthase TrpC [Ureibacillus terrenus]MED3764223.1 indole-3-glycerol phosphate synthase TrpC [Ureibacillus terrenus]TQE90827.1 indole-3-glycerol phosphate synthase TrpC [Ureibacillus terrenus]
MTILDTIIEHKKTLLPKLKATKPERNVPLKKRPSLYETLRKSDTLQVIAEMKRASPSKGIINAEADPVEQAKRYEKAGAACISVLTEEKFFKGSFEDLADISKNVNLPILNKDFIIDPVQIDYALHAGASVILLIVAALDDETLSELYDYATSRGLEVLVEVHNEEELERALRLHPKLIGVNNRDLKTFHMDLAQTEKLANIINQYEDIAFISESGIFETADAERVAKAGARAILVGESLMRSGNPEETLASFQVKLPTAEDVKP